MKAKTKVRPLLDRLGEKLKAMPNGCWDFQGFRSKGYGRIDNYRVHRAMWEIVFGPIPDDLCVLHNCDNPSCANPAHLFLGTHVDNMADKVAKGRASRMVGEEHPAARLTWEQVHAIRADNRSCPKIAKDYGVSHNQIWRIKSGKSWREPINE